MPRKKNGWVESGEENTGRNSVTYSKKYSYTRMSDVDKF
jgi:hypothetical protein